MSESSKLNCENPSDWDNVYRKGTPEWDTGKPHAELARVLDEYRLRPETVLEIGCGTGADAILLAKRRFEVTAIDCSPIAIERARARAEQHDALLRFVLTDFFEFAQSTSQYDFVYDCGVYHLLRQTHLEEYLDALWRVTQPGSYYLCLAGAPSDEPGEGPPQVSEEEIQNELGRLFEPIRLRPIRLECPANPAGHAAWSCFMQRPKVKKL